LAHFAEHIADLRQAPRNIVAPFRVARLLGSEPPDDIELLAIGGERGRKIALPSAIVCTVPEFIWENFG